MISETKGRNVLIYERSFKKEEFKEFNYGDPEDMFGKI